MGDDPNLERRKIVDSRNFSIGLLENLKKYLTRLFSDLYGMLKVVTWSVKVENQVELPKEMEIANLIDYRAQLSEIRVAIDSMPEQKETDLTPVVEAILALLDKPEKDFPSYDDNLVVSELKGLKTAIESLPRNMPKMEKAEKIDLKKVEKYLESLYELMKPKPMPKLPVAETVKSPVFLGEEIEYDEDGAISAIIEKYDTVTYIERMRTIWKDGSRKRIYFPREEITHE